MACCHKVMLLLDTAGGAARHSRVRRAALRLLTYLSCRFGLARVHWAFKFFDSQGARSRPSRVSDFRELGARSWEDFEEELEARLEDRAHLPGPAPRATHTHGALMETLLDYQWDRPEITSPTKPILRSSGRRLLDVESEAKEAEAALGGLVNAVFLLAPCPHSQRELLQFVSGCEAQAQRLPPTPKQVMEKLLPKRVQEVMVARKITFYWVDTTEWSKMWESPDHLGYWTVCELLHHGGGAVLPSESFSWDFAKAGEMLLRSEIKLSSEPHLSPWISMLPTDATLNRLLYNSPEYEALFPQMEGMLFLPVEAGKEIQETWTVTLEPLAMHQRHFQKPVRIFLKGSVAQWSLPTSSTLGTDSWMLQSPEESTATQRLLFQQLVSRLTAEELHLVADVDPGEGWPPITGVISPLSANATILTVFHTKGAEFQRHVLQTAVTDSPRDTASLFSDVVDGILNQTHDSLADTASAASPVPEWAQQELGHTTPWSPAVVEKWFPFCNISGASSNLMESFGSLQAASANKEESSKTEGELTHCLAELYQRKSREESTITHQEDSKKKRGVPRTPVRQKMNTMCRSLKMLNVARLNVKAQKLHPDGSPDVAVEKGTQKIPSGRTVDKLEDRGRTLRSSKPKDFKTEEELLSYIRENYQKTVATGEIMLNACARNMISTIKMFLKSKGTKELEVNCLNQVKSNLLKTSKSLRQNLGKKLDKEDKVRECQLQVFLRLEMCLQCPSINESTDDMEQVVEEANFLRMVCLTEDSAYLAEFLEEILRLYIDSIPKTLGNLYNSLGFVIPQKLAGVLPTDFFSDDSMTQENKSPLLSVPFLSSARRSVSGSPESDELEELRTRSAKKRRKNALIRHKSIAEVSQNLRQIEMPKVSKRTTKKENSHPAPQQPSQPVKGTVQEVTKVRRNLFNQELLSPSKRSLKRGLPRSHSVSAVEGLEDKLDNFKKNKGYHKLLTKSVAETPVHKQISKRLLHRQIKGRSSDPGPDIGVVEESPEKGDEISLRRSPRIKQLSFSRTHSASFYSVSQPKSRSVQRVHSFQQDKSDQRENSPVQSIRSPKSLLFGAMSEMISPSEKRSARMKKRSRNTLDSEVPAAYQTPKKSHQKSLSFSKTTPRRFSHTPQTPLYTPERLQMSPAKMTPTKQATFKEYLKDSSSPSHDSPLDSKITPQKRRTQAGEVGKQCRKTSDPRRSILECQPDASATPGVGTADSPAAPIDSRDDQKGLSLSQSPPERQSYPGPGLRSDWHASSPLLITSDTEHLTLLSEAEHRGIGNLKSNVSSVEEGEGLRIADAEEKSSLSHPGIPPSPPFCGPGSPLMPSCDMHCTTDGRQCQASAQLDNLSASAWHSTDSASPQTYEVELEMQASGLPKLRIKKIDPSSSLEAEPPSKEESSLGEESFLPALSMPRASRSLSKPEPTYVSPPCPRLSHSTPGKNGGQTYICQACTPTHGPSSTPSPFQTDGVPWTPSPKHSGKTTPDIIKDWPRRKRAVGCGAGSSSGRGEVNADLPGSLSLLESEGKDHGLELSIHKTPILEDFELEGVCQLPDQSPPRNSMPKAEEASSWGQFGLSSRKRVLLAKEEADCGAKRICDLREDSEVNKSKERSPSWSAWQLPSTGDDEVFVAGSTPPPSCAVRSCLSASALQALTQSPLLFQGKTPQSKDSRDEDVDVLPSTVEDSPFSRAFSRRRPISRTYTRKKLMGTWLEDL
ncbi:hypothetical protein H8959_003873 [Pygathrix nigripes]